MPGTLRLGTLRPWDPGPWDPWPWDYGNLEHGTLTHRTLEIGPWNLGHVTLKPRFLRARPWELNLWHRFLVSRPAPQIVVTLIMKHKFDNKKLGHLSRKLGGSSRWTKTFTKILWHFTKHKEIKKYLKVMGKCVEQVYFVEKWSNRN